MDLSTNWLAFLSFFNLDGLHSAPLLETPLRFTHWYFNRVSSRIDENTYSKLHYNRIPTTLGKNIVISITRNICPKKCIIIRHFLKQFAKSLKNKNVRRGFVAVFGLSLIYVLSLGDDLNDFCHLFMCTSIWFVSCISCSLRLWPFSNRLRARRRGLQSAVDHARIHSDLSLLEGNEESAVGTSQRLSHVHHPSLVEHSQRCV